MIKKILTLPVIIISFSLLISCTNTDWTRLKNAASIKIIGYSSNSELIQFNNSGKNFSPEFVLNAPKSKNKNFESFKFLSIPLYNKALKSVGFNVKRPSPKSNLNLKDSDTSTKYITENNVEVIVNMLNIFGFIDHSDTSKQKRQLALKTIVQFADKEGFIGEKHYFITASKARIFKNESTSFKRSDYKSIERVLVKKIQTDLQKIKGINKKKKKRHKIKN